MPFEQMSLFDDYTKDEDRRKKSKQTCIETSSVSDRILESFNISDIPFIDCDYLTIYPQIAEIIPEEKVKFEDFGLEGLIAAEIICASICHQMNWDFLRLAVMKKTRNEPKWLSPDSLSVITAEKVQTLFQGYNKPERIRADERASILRQVGELSKLHHGFINLFFDNPDRLLPEKRIRENLMQCSAFSQDPEEKKYQLLLQKLSDYVVLSAVGFYCKPTVDYHLIRCFLRRGLIFPRTKAGKDYVYSSETQRKESTVAALRKLCSQLIQHISNYTGMTIHQINQIEWHVGRSICLEGNPDCCLRKADSDWVKERFNKCPFFETCCAIKYNPKLLNIEEPTYLGTSY